MLFLLACTATTPTGPDTGVGMDTSVASDTADSGDAADTADTADSGDTGTLTADLLFDGSTAPPPLLGIGGQVWAGDTAWTPALDAMDARIVRIALNANLGSSAVHLPVDASAAEWDAWMDAHVLDAAPTFLDDLLATQALTDARGIRWIAHQWEAPPAWESGGVLRADRVDDFAAMTAALYRWLDDQGVHPTWIELANEPDGDWNSYIPPEEYSDLVVQTRADLDASGLPDLQLLGPGLAVLGGWTDPPLWVPTLSDEAVASLDGWSVHTWDDYAEAGEGHLFLEDRWQIFVEQVEARDATKPIFATEMGSKDTVFDGATYDTPDNSGCGAAAESDGYAIRVLAHVAVALNAGADAISFWEAADQTWECSRWGMLGVDGEPRRFHEALAAFTTALPADGGTVRAAEADLPAVAVLGATNGAVLVVNDGDARLTRTVAVTGGWTLREARGFATSDRLLRDELYDLAQATPDADLSLDTTNAAYFADDGHRAFRTADHDAAMTWTPGGTLTSARIVAWSWNGADPVSVRVESSVDGATWETPTQSEALTAPGWNRHQIEVPAFPAGTRALRVTLPANAAPAWSPQLGDVWLRWTRDDPAVLPSGAAPWTLDLPPGSAVVLVLER